MTTYIDDRTTDQHATHRLAVIGTDSFMSGWGGAEGGASYAGWAFQDDNYTACLNWVKGRSDMKRVRLVTLEGYRPNAAHTHIYIFKPELHK